MKNGYIWKFYNNDYFIQVEDSNVAKELKKNGCSYVIVPFSKDENKHVLKKKFNSKDDAKKFGKKNKLKFIK